MKSFVVGLVPLVALLGPVAAGCASGDGKSTGQNTFHAEQCTPDETGAVPPDRCTEDSGAVTATLPLCNTWVKVEPPGMTCGDGSQYKFFVSYSNKSNNLMIDFEPGGACWDYESCTGSSGIRGAANPNGIADDHMSVLGLMPLLNNTPVSPDLNPVVEYNKIFVSYCTGDIHTGNKTTTYTSADGSASVTYRHNGHANTMAVIDWVKGKFANVPKLLVTGCSAGGAGALLNYGFIRLGLGTQVQCGYLLNDSGPIFHNDGPSAQVEAKIREVWDTDSVVDQVPLPIDKEAIKTDPGLINVAVATNSPKDRIAMTVYRMDFNYSLYSYQRFFPGSTEEQIHDFFWQDLQGIMKDYDMYENMSYYIPFFRSDNCSHCVSIPPIGNEPIEPTTADALTAPWKGTEIQASNVTLLDYIRTLLDNTKPLQSYVEAVQPNESFTQAVSDSCMAGGGSIPGQGGDGG